MLELLVLFGLLPVAAASGWYLARRRSFSHRKRDASTLSSNYFRGLNYLLNEQPDKAIEVFLKLAEVNRETVETHLALGNLFRRRGEMDKAIRFHKHIMTRPSLTEEQRVQALLELGEDYMRAGLLDRAEKLFTELVAHDAYSATATRHLLAIYQQEKDWTKAIDQAAALQRITGEDSAPLIAHFHCELAQIALKDGDVEKVRRQLRQARRYQPGSVRARVLEGDLARVQEQWDAATQAYQSACELAPDYAVLLLEPLLECHQRAGTLEQARTWLEQLVERSRAAAPVVALARLISRRDPERAVEFLLGQLDSRLTVRGLEYLIQLMDEHGHGLEKINPALIRELMQRLLDGQPRFRCRQCGFSGQTWHWQCPSCRLWETTRPVSGVLGE